jgi:hypothetical protein
LKSNQFNPQTFSPFHRRRWFGLGKKVHKALDKPMEWEEIAADQNAAQIAISGDSS